MAFPARCECATPGQCPHTGRLMTVGLHAQCQANADFRRHLQQLPIVQTANGPTVEYAPTREIVERIKNPCIYITLEGKRTPYCGCTIYPCKKFGECSRIPSRIADLACCQTCTLYCKEEFIGDLASTMPAAELAEKISAGVRQWPDQVFGWPVTKEALQLLADRHLAAIPPVPGNRAGRGIVTCGGGRYDASLYVAVQMIRRYGCTLPIEVWAGPGEVVSPSVRKLAGVEVRDASELPGLRIRGGWASKTAALLNTRFAAFMFMDADAYPISDVTALFEHNPTGVVVFPDRTITDGWIQKTSYGPGVDWTTAPPPISGGHYLFRLPEAWPALWMAYHYDQHSDFWYAYTRGIGGYGDQDQMRAAITKTRTPWHIYADQCEYKRGVFRYYGPDGRIIFIHRAAQKFGRLGTFPTPVRRNRWCEAENEAWGFYNTWKILNSIPTLRRARRCQ